MTKKVTTLGDQKRHYRLAVTMARASGTDLVQAYADGRLSEQEWADVVQRCRACSWVQGCQCWLGQAEWGTQTVPSACVNRGIFEGLKIPPTSDTAAE